MGKKITLDDVLTLHLALRDFDGRFDLLFEELDAQPATVKEAEEAYQAFNRQFGDERDHSSGTSGMPQSYA